MDTVSIKGYFFIINCTPKTLGNLSNNMYFSIIDQTVLNTTSEGKIHFYFPQYPFPVFLNFDNGL